MGVGAESVGAHTYGVAVAAMLLADEVRASGVKIDGERLLRLALLHDWAEARTGDMPRIAASAYYGAEARKHAEHRAFNDIIESLPGELAAGYRELHSDYEERRSLESRLVKAADVIDLLAQALTFERAGVRGLDEFWEEAGRRDFQFCDRVVETVVNRALSQLANERAKLKRDLSNG